MAQLTDKPEGAKLLTILQACEVAGVSRRSIYSWLNSGKLDYLRTQGGAVRIVESSLFRKAGA